MFQSFLFSVLCSSPSRPQEYRFSSRRPRRSPVGASQNTLEEGGKNAEATEKTDERDRPKQMTECGRGRTTISKPASWPYTQKRAVTIAARDFTGKGSSARSAYTTLRPPTDVRAGDAPPASTQAAPPPPPPPPQRPPAAGVRARTGASRGASLRRPPRPPPHPRKGPV